DTSETGTAKELDLLPLLLFLSRWQRRFRHSQNGFHCIAQTFECFPALNHFAVLRTAHRRSVSQPKGSHFAGKGRVRVTPKMKKAGAKVLFQTLGFQFTPDYVDLESLAQTIFLSMLDASPREDDLKVSAERQ